MNIKQDMRSFMIGLTPEVLRQGLVMCPSFHAPQTERTTLLAEIYRIAYESALAQVAADAVRQPSFDPSWN